MRITAALLLGAAAACTTSTTSSPVIVDGGGAARDEDAGTRQDGVYTCCAPGKGVTCCTADAGLLGYDFLPDGAVVVHGAAPGRTEANCFPDLGTCVPNGEPIDGKVICLSCCDGLVNIPAVAPDDAGACMPTGVGLVICAPCGDGVCSATENRCNCPSDCM